MTALFSDRKYFKRVPPGSLAEKLTLMARDRIYTGFMRLCAPARDAAILDVGVSSFPHPAANVLERKYPFASRLTAAGMGKGDGFREMFPQVRYVQLAPDGPLPFANDEFAIAIANAVLEHVGSADKQRVFLGELTRVARAAFVVVPNRLFPVEHHTMIPLLHYAQGPFRLACLCVWQRFPHRG